MFPQGVHGEAVRSPVQCVLCVPLVPNNHGGGHFLRESQGW